MSSPETVQEISAFGRWLKRLRAQHDLTQEALAERVSCSPQTVRMLESGRRRPSYVMAERLAEILDVSMAERSEFLRLARQKSDYILKAGAEQPTPLLSPQRPRLPTPPTVLIGRQHEQREITTQLSTFKRRLVTIVGPGGAGKTRLVVQCATDLASLYADGATFVSLASIKHVDAIAPAIATACGYRLSSGSATEAEILHFLQDRNLLLVLDNLEHLLDAVDFLIEILQRAPDVYLLATSRERLRIQPEWVINLGGLALPDAEAPEAIVRSEAVLLFTERARSINGSFVLTPQNQLLIAEICRRLDGLPLALELAAAQISVLSPATLLQRLNFALPLLIDGARDLPPRQRTMRAAIEWSYQLLTDDERTIFARLSVFMGGGELGAVETVCADEQFSSCEILPLLRRLVDQSLVALDHSTADSRYRLLEPIRQFAFEQLVAKDGVAIQARHARYFLALAEDAAPRLESAAQVVWLNKLEMEYSNFRVAIHWFIEQQDYNRAARICWALWIYFWMRGRLHEGRRWIEEILRHTEPVEPQTRGTTLLTAMVIGFGMGDYSWAASYIDECFAIFEGLQDAKNLAHATSLAALNLAGLQQYEAAEPLMALGVQRYLAVDSLWNASMLLTFWAAIPRNRSDYAQAMQLINQALELAQQQGDHITMYSSLFNLASIARAQGAHSEAICQFRNALVLAVEVGDTGNIISCFEGIAETAAAQGDIPYAAKLWGAAEALGERKVAAIYSYAPDRTQYDASIDKAQRLLPDDTWSMVWDEGRTATVEEMVDFALHTDPVPAEPHNSNGVRTTEC